MTVVETLKEYRKLNAEIRAIELDVEELKDAEDIGLSPISYEERTGKTYKFNSYTENVAIELNNRLETLKIDMRYKERDINRIDNALNILDDNEREIIELKYLKGYRWDIVTLKLDRSYQQCKRIEKKAMEKVINMV